MGRLNRETNRILADDAFRQPPDGLGLEPIGGTPADTAATIREEADRAREVILGGEHPRRVNPHACKPTSWR